MSTVIKSDDQWSDELSEEQYQVLRKKGTETPFTGRFVFENGVGTYVCAGCGIRLFSSSTKFDSHCGWPSFYDALPGSVEFHKDTTHGMIRIEVACVQCGGHLGHIFDDAPDRPGGKRYCINSVSLDFISKKP